MLQWAFMTNTVVALFIAASASTWIYAKLMRSSGNNTKSSLIAAGISAVFVYALSLILLNLIPS